MKFLLDANACILLLAGHPRLVARVAQCEAGDVAVSAIAFAEVALGTWNGKQPSPMILDAFSKQIPVVEFDLAAARQYAQLPFKRGSFDRLLAAHTLSLGLTLVTNNIRHFADIPGLQVEDWTL